MKTGDPVCGCSLQFNSLHYSSLPISRLQMRKEFRGNSCLFSAAWSHFLVLACQYVGADCVWCHFMRFVYSVSTQIMIWRSESEVRAHESFTINYYDHSIYPDLLTNCRNYTVVEYGTSTKTLNEDLDIFFSISKQYWNKSWLAMGTV